MKGETMRRDPVCGAVVHEERFGISYEGEKYHLCSVKCKKRSRRNPRRFVK